MRIQALRAGLFAIVVLLLAGGRTAAQERAAQPMAEGIRVHGRWIIEVYDQGSLLEEHEFMNELVGSELITEVLAGERFVGPGQWRIRVREQVCGDQTGECIIVPEGTQSSSDRVYATLTVDTPGPPDQMIALEGSFVADAPGDIVRVATDMGVCQSSSSETPDTCTFDGLAAYPGALTRKVLADPIPIAAGQTANIRVELTFD